MAAAAATATAITASNKTAPRAKSGPTRGVEASKFVRSRAASARNLQLLAELESSLRPSDYQLCYPQLLQPSEGSARQTGERQEHEAGNGAGDEDQGEDEHGDQEQDESRQEQDESRQPADVSHRLPRRLSARQSNLRQSSVVQGASNWLHPTDRQLDKQQRHQQQQHQLHPQRRHPQPLQATLSASSSMSGPPTPSAPAASASKLQQSKATQVLGHYNRTNVVIKAFNYKLRLDLELNKFDSETFSTQRSSANFYTKTRTLLLPCQHSAGNSANGHRCLQDLQWAQKKHPHIIYRYQSSHGFNQPDSANSALRRQQQTVRLCANARLHQWALRQYSHNGDNISTTTNSNNNNNHLNDNNGNNNNNNLSHIAAGARQRFERNYDPANSNSTLTASAANQDDYHGRLVKSSSHSMESSYQHINDCDSDGQTGISNTSSSSCKTISGSGGSNRQVQMQVKAQGNAQGNAYRRGKKFTRDVSLTEKYIELALVLSQDMFDKRNTSSRLEVLHDSIQIINCLDLYFRHSANTRVALIYLETWAYGDQIDLSSSGDVKQILYNFLEYTTRKLYKVSMDAAHLLTGGHAHTFDSNEMGMSIPDSICSTRAVSVSQEASTFEPFIAAATMAHMLGHNLGMEHDIAGHQQGQYPQPPSHQAGEADSLSSASASAAELHLHPSPGAVAELAPTALKQPTAHSHRAEMQEQNEDQDDEIKGRSLVNFSSNQRDDQQQYEDNSSASSRSVGEQEKRCGSSCLMSESFIYVQPPVSFGNMIQQQVASAATTSTTNAGNGTILSVLAAGVDELDDNREPAVEASSFNPQVSSTFTNHQLPFRFSRRSIDTYHGLLRTGRGICLFNKPNQLEDFRTCGNGIVDRGEDCDCGSFQECLENGDTCCDPITCRFKADAECISGACCDRCRLRPKGLVCRRARGECDLAELCDGKSGHCAPDVQKQNGYPCANNTGYCYLGQCPSHDAQCSELWGLDGRKSHRYCYSTFNSNGTIRGNCGLEQSAGGDGGSSSQRKYRRCEQDNVLCGTLQCQMGDMKPTVLLSSTDNSSSDKSASLGTQQAEFSKKVIHSIDGGYHECKTITGPSGSSLQVSYVREGSKCGPNRVCSNQTCQPIEKVYRDSFELCPRDERGRQCSANGVCSTANRCHCEPGWLGHDCSQKVGSPTSLVMDASLSGQSVLDLVKPSLTLLEPINVTEMPSRQMQPTASPPSSAAPAGGSVAPPEVVSTANPNTSSVTTAVTPAPTPAPPVVSPSNVVLDKKKHDALGAPTLVFILVSIVAAVYVGFALMANCYRRDKLIRPDKVLRHHQMNCKLDAMRSSFIAKRLAEAGVAGSFDQQSGSTSLMQAPPMLAPDASFVAQSALSNPNLFGQASVSAQFAMEEDAAMRQPYDHSRGSHVRGFLPSAFKRYPFSGLRNAPVSNAIKQPLQTNAKVHYFEADQRAQQQQQQYHGQQHSQRAEYPAEPTDSCDHIPLLTASSSQQHHHAHQHQHKAPMSMRSFKSQQQRQLGQMLNYPMTDTSSARQLVLQPIISRGRSMSRQASKATNLHYLNRATSLGSVNHARQDTQWNSFEADDSEGLDEPGRSRYAHKVLATPVRTGRGYRQGPSSLAAPLNDDSFSANSSPEPAFGAAGWLDEDGFNRAAQANSRPLLMSARPGKSYQADLLMGALNRTEDDEDDDLDALPFTPPPPPAKAAARLVGSSMDPADDLMSTEEESTELSTVIQCKRQQQQQAPPGTKQHQSEPELVAKKASPVWLRQRIKRIPLNNSGQDADSESKLVVGDEQLSLLSQLRQLEQVQSLHQRQVANQKPANESGSLHEFFSLPLSVQLSALLARTLDGSQNQLAWQTTPIDEYLNTLNSSSVATMSRRSFKSSSLANNKQPVGAANGGSGTMKRQQQQQQQQQVKLQNLQSLISRLQKLQLQQQLQQQQQQQKSNHIDAEDEDDDVHTESVHEKSFQVSSQSRQSTLGRRSLSRNSRQVVTADDLGNVNRRRMARRATPRRSPDNRNESVYSMSDSEEGNAYASRAFCNSLQRRSRAGAAASITPDGQPKEQAEAEAEADVEPNKQASEAQSVSSDAKSSSSKNQCQSACNESIDKRKNDEAQSIERPPDELSKANISAQTDHK